MLRRRLLLVAGGLVVLLLGAAAGGWLYLRSATPDPGRDGVVPALSAPVEVWRDAYGIPHVWASNEPDLMRAMGYVHAQERLWQMELLRRVTQGRLAEILGPDLVDTDKFLRTLGLDRAAEGDAQLLTPDDRALLEAYAEGVNAWLADMPGALPPEFVLLRFSPEPWTLRNSLAIAKVMAWDLTLWELELSQQRILDMVGPDKAREAEPLYPAWAPTTLPDPPAPTPPADPATPAPASPAPGPASPPQGRLLLPHFPPTLRDLVGRASFARASNVYVVAGTRTRTGKPLLANDMHLGLQAPSLWYLAALHGGGIDAAGLTIPGLPLVIVGRNRDVAWGYAAAQVDDVDYFIEQIDPADPSRYQTPDGPQPFELRTERIPVSGGAPVEHTVRATRHGPVLSDVEPRAGERVLALRWTAAEPGQSFHAILQMNRARTVDELTAGLALFPAPALNVMYADREGTIGYQLAGRIPVRRSGDGLRPAPGWTGSHDWTGYLAPEDAPRSVNPPEGFLVNANNRQIGPGYPHFITRRWAEPFRAVRLRQLILDTPSISYEDAARHQRDLVDTFALRYLPLAIRGAERAGQAGIAAELAQWNGDARPDSRAAALFYVWFHDLRRVLHEDEAAGRSLPYSYAAVIRLLDAGGGVWVDDTRTPAVESLDEVLARAWSNVVQQVGDKRWGDLHQTLYPHALGVSAPVEWLLGVNVGPLPSGGSWHTVDATDFGSDSLPIESTFGASERHVIDLADPDDGGWFLLPTGQSGVPFSPHYRDQSALWQEGKLVPIPLTRARAESLAVDRAVLRPGAGDR